MLTLPYPADWPCVERSCSRDRLVDGLHGVAGADHLNRGIDGVFKIVRVVRRGLASIAEVHAIGTRAHLAQSEPKMARDRFGFLERHGVVQSHSGSTHEADTTSFGETVS
jgi:hypothetical protein